MKAKVTKAFSGVPDGEVHPRQFEQDDYVTGALAEVAVREGWALEEKKPAPVRREKPLAKMTADELKAFAAEKGIDISAAKTEAEMIAVIEAAPK